MYSPTIQGQINKLRRRIDDLEKNSHSHRVANDAEPLAGTVVKTHPEAKEGEK